MACLIAISQLPKVFGVSGGSGTFFQQLGQFIAKLPQTNVYSLALSVGAIVLILAIKRFRPIIPGALVALILGILTASIFQREVNADQELLAMGAANISSGLFQGITIDMSLSSTASGEAAGERTQRSTLVSSGVIPGGGGGVRTAAAQSAHGGVGRDRAHFDPGPV